MDKHRAVLTCARRLLCVEPKVGAWLGAGAEPLVHISPGLFLGVAKAGGRGRPVYHPLPGRSPTVVGEARRGASLPPKARRGRAQLTAETCPVCSHQRPAARAAARTTGALLQPCGRRWASGGEGRAAFFSGVCSASCLCPPHAFARCQLFSLPVSVTDVLGIFPDHIHLAASFRCRLLQAVGVPPACAELYLEFVSLLGYF